MCADYLKRKGDDSGSGWDTCELDASCTTAVKKDGTCAASRDECEDASAKPPSMYWYIDTDNDKKCKKKTAAECDQGDYKYLKIDGTCAQACDDF